MSKYVWMLSGSALLQVKMHYRRLTVVIAIKNIRTGHRLKSACSAKMKQLVSYCPQACRRGRILFDISQHIYAAPEQHRSWTVGWLITVRCDRRVRVVVKRQDPQHCCGCCCIWSALDLGSHQCHFRLAVLSNEQISVISVECFQCYPSNVRPENSLYLVKESHSNNVMSQCLLMTSASHSTDWGCHMTVTVLRWWGDRQIRHGPRCIIRRANRKIQE
jgi:hypothetical protein